MERAAFTMPITAPIADRSERPERLAYRVREAAEVLAISRSHLYTLVADGQIRVLKDGARTLIRRCELEAYLDRLESRAPPAKPPRRKLAPSRP